MFSIIIGVIVGLFIVMLLASALNRGGMHMHHPAGSGDPISPPSITPYTCELHGLVLPSDARKDTPGWPLCPRCGNRLKER